MKAIIMAGGEGSRLRPLTCDCPKPMLRLMGKPLMEYAVQLLKKHGISEIAATLGYLPDSIMDYFGDGESLGVHMRYYIDKMPLGTAGSVKQAQDFLDETFVVLSGDGITDIDLGDALQFHRQKGALATLILKNCINPREYGMVVTAPDGRIRSFHEKPGHSDIYSNLVNTGIYILEPEVLNYIPRGESYDFGHDLFPALVESSLGIYGFTAQGYWCDVGDVAAYLRVHEEALDGKIHLHGLDGCAYSAALFPHCRAESPVYIAPNAQIDPGARIGAYSVISEGCHISSEASIKRSILLPGCHVEPGAQLRGCICGANSIINTGAQLYEESVVGTSSHIGCRAVLPPGVKIWPEKVLPDGEHPRENIIWGSRREDRFIQGAIMLETPAQATRAAQACMAQAAIDEVIIGRAPSSVAAAMWHATASGAMAQGVQVIDGGVCSLPQIRHAQAMLHTQAALYVESDRLIPLNSAGIRLSEKIQRNIIKWMDRQDFSPPFSGITRPMIHAGNTAAAYIADTAAAFQGQSGIIPEIVLCAPVHQDLSEQILLRSGLQIRIEYGPDHLRPRHGEIGLFLSETGEDASLCDCQGTLDDVHMQLARAWTALELGECQLILPLHATRAVDVLAAAYDAHVLYLPGEDAVWQNALAEKSSLQLRLHQDGLWFALAFLSMLCKKGLDLIKWRREMPGAHRSHRDMQIPIHEGGRLLYTLANRSEAEMGGGVRLTGKRGWAWLSLDDAGSRLSITAEALDTEAAQELCAFYSGEIERLLTAHD